MTIQETVRVMFLFVKTKKVRCDGWPLSYVVFYVENSVLDYWRRQLSAFIFLEKKNFHFQDNNDVVTPHPKSNLDRMFGISST